MTRRLIALVLTLALLALLIALSADFFFRQPYYEAWDLAANSLSVGRAKHFAELYGPYSRWGFHHPGPACFYALALGEWLFYDWLHLTPAPYNAQALAQLCISMAFYGASLAVFARRLPVRAGAWFWPLAIVLGAAHFGCASELPSYDFVRGPSAFTSTWSAHELVMPLLCLLAAGASVAAGEGRDLPLLAAAAGTLLHLHVAQPLFVVPLTLLAYFGLVVICARHERATNPNATAPLRPWAAWRAFRGRHLAAGLILAVFALPLVLDLCRGADSNFAAIVHHLRTHHGDHKSLVKSALYFLQFGAHAPYQPGRLDFGHFDGAGAVAFLRGHALVYTGWLLALLVVIAVAVRPLPDPLGRGRFLAWAGAFLFAVIGLTLYWGTIQDGEMFYYNSWLNFAIYYFGLLIMVTEFAARRNARPLPVGWRWSPWSLMERLAVVAVAAVYCVAFADRWHVRDAAPETTALLHESIGRVLAATPTDAAPRGMAAFEFPAEEWPVAAAVGLEMARAGRRFEVRSQWVNEFGSDHTGNFTSHYLRAAQPWRFEPGPDAVPWRSDSPESLARTTQRLRERLAAGSAPAVASDFPLPDDTHLSTAVPTVDLGDGRTAEIRFQRGGNAPRYQFDGWSDAEPWGTWSNGRSSSLRIAVPEPLPAGSVEMTVELHPFVLPAAGLTSQRLRVRFNGQPLGPEQRVVEGGPPLVWTIPAELWDGAHSLYGATLEFELPDAASPAALDRTGHLDDTRLLGVGVSRVLFRAAGPSGSP